MSPKPDLHPSADPRAAVTRALPPGRSLNANIVAAVAGAGLYNLARLAVVVLIAKLATVELLGSFNYGMALSAPLALLLGLELRAVLVSDTTERYPFGAYRILRSLGMSAAAVILAVILGIEAAATGRVEHALLAGGVCAARLAWGQSELVWGAYQRRERFDLVAWSNGLRGLALLIPFAVLLPLARLESTADAQPALIIWATITAAWVAAAAWGLLHWWFDRPRIAADPALDPAWTWPAVMRLAAEALPLGIVQLLITLCDSVPRLWIASDRASGMTSLGYFGALSHIALAANILLVTVANAASNRLAVYYRTDLRAFLRLAAGLTALALALGAVLVLAAWLWAEPILRIALSPDYARFADEFVLLIAANSLLLLASAFGFVTTFMRLFWIQVPMHAAVLAATLWASWEFIPADPVRGGAIVAMVRAAVHTSLYAASVLFGIWAARSAHEKPGRSRAE